MRTLIFSLLFATAFYAQDSIVNPKGKWFFGVEMGNNKVLSTASPKSNSFQGGILTEYYFANNWSLTGRLKYFETGYNDPRRKVFFSGNVVSAPINIKWEYRIFGNFKGNIATGFATNYEIKSQYNYPENIKSDYPKLYLNFNAGLGFSYFVNDKLALYSNYEFFVRGNEKDEGWFSENSTDNAIFNVGVKYNLDFK